MPSKWSSIRRKTAFTLSVTTLALVVVMTATCLLILLPGLSHLEGYLAQTGEARAAYNSGLESIALFMGIMLAAIFIYALVVSRSLDRAVIGRLEEISGEIERIRQDKDFSARIDLPGNDELASLAGGI